VQAVTVALLFFVAYAVSYIVKPYGNPLIDIIELFFLIIPHIVLLFGYGVLRAPPRESNNLSLVVDSIVISAASLAGLVLILEASLLLTIYFGGDRFASVQWIAKKLTVTNNDPRAEIPETSSQVC
jgi:hypothetical protein